METSFKVVHVGMSAAGGAGIAALRLHAGLLEQGVDSRFLCLYPPRPSPGVYAFEPSLWARGRQRLSSYGVPVTRYELDRRKLRHAPQDYELFTFPRSDFDVASHRLVQEADIVHLHWIAGFVDYPTFFARVRQPIVWTLHDANPMQGGFHYPGDVERNRAALGDLDHKLKRQKEAWIAEARHLTVIGPSRWMVETSEASVAFAGRPHLHVPYGLDTETFSPQLAALGRSTFGFPERARVVALTAADLRNRRKGLDLFVDAVRQMPLPEDVVVVALGEGGLAAGRVRAIGPVDDARAMASFLAAADVVVVPSREDNFPNVVIESLSCGTPVVATPVGGIPEAVVDGVDGRVARTVSPEALAEALGALLAQPRAFDRQRIRARAVERFALHVQAKRVLGLYRDLLASPRTVQVPRAGAGR